MDGVGIIGAIIIGIVAGWIADDDVFEHGAVGKTEQRKLVFVLTARSEIVHAVKALHLTVEMAVDAFGRVELDLARGFRPVDVG